MRKTSEKMKKMLLLPASEWGGHQAEQPIHSLGGCSL
jgi:hypothetical protein